VPEAHAFLAERADKDRLRAIEPFPLAAVRALREINLLRHRRLFAGEGDEQKPAIGGEDNAGESGQQEKEEALHVFVELFYRFRMLHNFNFARKSVTLRNELPYIGMECSNSLKHKVNPDCYQRILIFWIFYTYSNQTSG
jgi:hypothetical protein